MDGQLAVIGLGSVGSMALWQASKLSGSVVGFDASAPAHPRSAVGGDTRLFRMMYKERHNYYPLLKRSQDLWRQLEAESSRQIFNQCGGLSIGLSDGPYLPRLLENIRNTGHAHELLSYEQMAERFPQHNLTPDESAILDPEAGFLRTDTAVLAALDVACSNGAVVNEHTPIDDVVQTGDSVTIRSGGKSWEFANVIVAAGSWSARLLPEPLRDFVRPHRLLLSWFNARVPQHYAPEQFPIFAHIKGELSLYGTPSLDVATVKAALDNSSAPTADPSTMARELTPEEIAESSLTISEFLPGLVPNIVRSDSYPDLYTADETGILGSLPSSPRIYCATGFSGIGFKMSTGFGVAAASEALGVGQFTDLDFARPSRFVGADSARFV